MGCCDCCLFCGVGMGVGCDCVACVLLNLRHHQGTRRLLRFFCCEIFRFFLFFLFIFLFLFFLSFLFSLLIFPYYRIRSEKLRSSFLHRMPLNLFPLRTLLSQLLLLLYLLLLLHPFPSLIWCCRLLRLRQAIPLPLRSSPPPTLPRFLFSRPKLPPSPSITCRACPWHRCPP